MTVDTGCDVIVEYPRATITFWGTCVPRIINNKNIGFNNKINTSWSSITASHNFKWVKITNNSFTFRPNICKFWSLDTLFGHSNCNLKS